MRNILLVKVLAVIFAVSFASFAYAQAATITSFDTNSHNIISGETVQLTWAGSEVSEYRLLLECPKGISATLEKNKACNAPLLMGENTKASLRFVNTLSHSQSITVKLRAYGSGDKFDQELQLTVTVEPIPSTSATITFFNATNENVSPGSLIEFSWSGNDVDHYTLYFDCPASAMVMFEKQNVCDQPVSLGKNTSVSARIAADTQTPQQIPVELRAYGKNDKYDSNKNVVVNVQQDNDSNSPVQDTSNAKITSFTLDEDTVTTRFNGNNPAARLTAHFSGMDTDTWKITLDCPVPITVNGLEERINIIKSGTVGVSSPSKEGQQCNITQEGSASLSQFSFLLINPFKTPQSATLTLGAYSWNGSENVRGDVQSRAITVLPN